MYVCVCVCVVIASYFDCLRLVSEGRGLCVCSLPHLCIDFSPRPDARPHQEDVDVTAMAGWFVTLSDIPQQSMFLQFVRLR